jgi:hypothetical protein
VSPWRVWYVSALMTRAAAIALASLVHAGCGAPDVHAAYRRIQLAEARIAHAAHDLSEAPERDDRCRAICLAAEDIEREAAGLEGEADASARAARASDRCVACERSAR